MVARWFLLNIKHEIGQSLKTFAGLLLSRMGTCPPSNLTAKAKQGKRPVIPS
jgi:hypothetical protein